ncbi:MAG: glutathione synthase [Rickettsiales bacterium]|nr:glutathione synthase [Rickettsiales bacterium]
MFGSKMTRVGSKKSSASSRRKKAVAIQMDPLDSLNPKTDSTLLLGLEAQRRGYQLFVYTPDKLTYREGAITARAHEVTLHANPAHYYDIKGDVTLTLSDMQVVLLRQDPPFNMEYISTTYLLEMLMPKTLVANHPGFVRHHPEKLFPTLFKHYAPPTLITADPTEIEAFWRDYSDVVMKPLYGHGGNAVFRLKKGDQNIRALMEMVFSVHKEPWVVQPFLPEVAEGERRIILIDGEFAGIVGRIPPAGEIRSNLRIGGTPRKAKLTKKQREVCEALRPALKEKGLILAGIDMIGDYLIEVNLTSPTTLVTINKLEGLTLERDVWDAIEARL